MSVEVRVPAFGESVKEGVIVRWLKNTGDYVRKDEDLVEIETDKATSPLPSPASGKLTVTVPEGKKVLIDAVIANIDEKATAPAASSAQSKPASAKATPEPEKAAAAKPSGVAAPAPAAPPMSPAARVL